MNKNNIFAAALAGCIASPIAAMAIPTEQITGGAGFELISEGPLLDLPPAEGEQSVDAFFFYDIETGDEIEVKVVEEGPPPVSVFEELVKPGSVRNPFSEYGNQFEIEGMNYNDVYQPDVVQYTVINNLAEFDIVAFGVTNPGYGTNAFTPEGIECETVVSGNCWSSETVSKNDLREFSETEEQAEMLALIFDEDRVLHFYAFDENEEDIYRDPNSPLEIGAVKPSDDPRLSDLPPEVLAQLDKDFFFEQALAQEAAGADGPPDGQEAPTAILANSISDHFFFENGLPASNLFGIGVGANGQQILFTNVQLNTPSQVPLPAGALLLMSGLAGMGALRKARKA